MMVAAFYEVNIAALLQHPSYQAEITTMTLNRRPQTGVVPIAGGVLGPQKFEHLPVTVLGCF